jgi:hypothetical protein
LVCTSMRAGMGQPFSNDDIAHACQMHMQVLQVLSGFLWRQTHKQPVQRNQ